MARSMADVAALLAAIAGYDRADPRSVEHPLADPLAGLHDGVEGLRVALAQGFFAEDVEPAVERGVRAVAEQLASLGAAVQEIDVPGAGAAFDDATTIMRAETFGLHRERLAEAPERFGEDVRRRLELGRDVSGADVAQAIARMYEWRVRMLELFDDVDLVLTPTTSTTAPLLEGAEMIAITARLMRLTYPWSLASMPAASIPCGLDEAGLPVGAQLAAAPRQDALVLRAGVAIQSATDWHRARPPA
jgi:aspartyl-tRNA(Asn)/glutamyl-tRNA(Gln) amidotransferase subunit A